MDFQELQRFIQYNANKHPTYFGCRINDKSGEFQLFFRDRPVSPLMSFVGSDHSLVMAVHALDRFTIGLGEKSWMEEAWRIDNNGAPTHEEWKMGSSKWFTYLEREMILSLITITYENE